MERPRRRIVYPLSWPGGWIKSIGLLVSSASQFQDHRPKALINADLLGGLLFAAGHVLREEARPVLDGLDIHPGGRLDGRPHCIKRTLPYIFGLGDEIALRVAVFSGGKVLANDLKAG